ncbi:rhodanese-like domain-containing protein [Planctomycetota bacterium]
MRQRILPQFVVGVYLLITFCTLLILAGCQSPQPIKITPKDTKGFIDFNTPMLVIDVREPDEFCNARGHIQGARNYPWDSGVLQERFRELPPQAPIIVVSRSGRRSLKATEFLRARGYTKTLSMGGGMKAWEWDTELCVDPNSPENVELSQ